MSAYKLWIEVDGDIYAGPVVLQAGDVFTVSVPDLSSATSVAIAEELRVQTNRANDLAHRLWQCEQAQRGDY